MADGKRLTISFDLDTTGADRSSDAYSAHTRKRIPDLLAAEKTAEQSKVASHTATAEATRGQHERLTAVSMN